MTLALERIRHTALREKIMTATEAAEFVQDGMLVGMSGFTGAGYPKALPTAIAERAQAIHAEGKPFQISVITGASTAPECDGVLAASDSLKLRSPFQSDPTLRNDINAGKIAYTDIHLSQIEQQVRFGFFGAMDVAIIEVVGITEEGKLIPSMSVGPNNQWVKSAQKIILEVNVQQHAKLETMHDVFADIGTPPHRRPLLLLNPNDRIGSHYIDCDLDKIVAIVFTDAPDRNSKFTEPDAVSRRIAEQIIEFFAHEVKHGRLPENLCNRAWATLPTPCWQACNTAHLKTSQASPKCCKTECWICCSRAKWQVHPPPRCRLAPTRCNASTTTLTFCATKSSCERKKSPTAPS